MALPNSKSQIRPCFQPHNFFIFNVHQVFTRKLEILKVKLDSQSHFFLAKPTAQILLESPEEEESNCSTANSYKFDQCLEEEISRIMIEAGGCTYPWVTNKTKVCNHTNDWQKFFNESKRRVSLFLSHRYKICRRQNFQQFCSIMFYAMSSVRRVFFDER